MNTANDLHILYEHERCLAVCKPAGLPTQAPHGYDSLEQRVKRYLQQALGLPHPPYLGMPHRLDRPVSGIVVMAKRVNAARKLSKQFERRQVRKIYWAIVEGHVAPDEGTWRDCLRKVPGESRAEVVPADHPEARSAVLHYRLLRTDGRCSLLQIELETGRMHQIRVQAACRGWPVLGDALYGSTLEFGPVPQDVRQQPIALHACELTFIDPLSRVPLTIRAAPGADWQEVLQTLGWHEALRE
jgi:23S rRNA pseudouridine1911/1915/1917 synthase